MPALSALARPADPLRPRAGPPLQDGSSPPRIPDYRWGVGAPTFGTQRRVPTKRVSGNQVTSQTAQAIPDQSAPPAAAAPTTTGSGAPEAWLLPPQQP